MGKYTGWTTANQVVTNGTEQWEI